MPYSTRRTTPSARAGSGARRDAAPRRARRTAHTPRAGPPRPGSPRSAPSSAQQQQHHRRRGGAQIGQSPAAGEVDPQLRPHRFGQAAGADPLGHQPRQQRVDRRPSDTRGGRRQKHRPIARKANSAATATRNTSSAESIPATTGAPSPTAICAKPAIGQARTGNSTSARNEAASGSRAGGTEASHRSRISSGNTSTRAAAPNRISVPGATADTGVARGNHAHAAVITANTVTQTACGHRAVRPISAASPRGPAFSHLRHRGGGGTGKATARRRAQAMIQVATHPVSASISDVSATGTSPVWRTAPSHPIAGHRAAATKAGQAPLPRPRSPTSASDTGRSIGQPERMPPRSAPDPVSKPDRSRSSRPVCREKQTVRTGSTDPNRHVKSKLRSVPAGDVARVQRDRAAPGLVGADIIHVGDVAGRCRLQQREPELGLRGRPHAPSPTPSSWDRYAR